MAKLHTMHNLVFDILTREQKARGDDYFLYGCVCAVMGFKPCETTLMQFAHHKESGLPSWETVTRCRRKIQSEHPELCDPTAKKYRAAEIEEYKEYAKE